MNPYLLFTRLINKTDMFLNIFRVNLFVFFCKKNVQIGKSILIFSGFKIKFNSDDFRIKLGNNIVIRRNFSLIIEGYGDLNVGNNVFFNNNCSISCLGKITIGNDCIIGENVKLYDHNHNYKDNNMLIREQGYTTGKIVIGNNVWIGSNVIILNNVTIGDNIVIGSNCLVYKDIPDNSIVKHKEELIISKK